MIEVKDEPLLCRIIVAGSHGSRQPAEWKIVGQRHLVVNFQVCTICKCNLIARYAYAQDDFEPL